MKGDVIAIISGIAAALGLVTAILGARAAIIASRTAAKVQSISVQVDGRLSDMITSQGLLLVRQGELMGALHNSGTPIPPTSIGGTTDGFST